MLTATGMRQRYLMGRYNREKYIDGYGLLDPQFNPGQVYAQSTGVDRTLQSTYSQFFGMYPPITTSNLNSDSLSSKKGLPPLKVRKQS